MNRLTALIQKAFAHQRGGESRGVVSGYVPGIASRWGQPNLQGGDAYGLITPQRMREIVLKTPTAGAALNAILDYSTGVKVKVRNTDPSKPAPARAAKFITDILKRPNPQDSQRRFERKLYRDLLTMGYALIEVERGESGNIANLWPLDAARVRVDFDKHGSIHGFNMLDINGSPIVGRDGVHTWPAEDIVYFQLDPTTESGFPVSRITQLFACAVIESLMLAYIGGRFTDSNIPFGVMDLGDITQDELDSAILLWNQQMEQDAHPEHKILFTGSKGGARWTPFGYDMQKLEAPELLSRVRLQILGIVGVTVNEIGEADSVNKANGYNLSYTFKKRAIEPILDEYTEEMTFKLLHAILSFSDCELYYEDIDSRDELLQGQIDDLYWKIGVLSTNHIRNRKGLPNIEGGDEPSVALGQNVIPVSMLREFAKVQLEALQMVNFQTQVGIAQALQAMQQPVVNPDGTTSPPPALPQLASLPLIRGMQPPERFSTPLGSGSSTAKFKMPKPGMKPPAQAPGSPRGPVEQNKRQGLRKENM